MVISYIIEIILFDNSDTYFMILKPTYPSNRFYLILLHDFMGDKCDVFQDYTPMKPRVAMDFTGSQSRIVDDPKEAKAIAAAEGHTWKVPFIHIQTLSLNRPLSKIGSTHKCHF